MDSLSGGRTMPWLGRNMCTRGEATGMDTLEPSALRSISSTAVEGGQAVDLCISLDSLTTYPDGPARA